MSRKIMSLVVICAMLAGCVTSVEQLRKSNLKGNDFQSELARQYLDFAEAEADQYDWFNSAYFAKKGLKAIAGENPAPENLDTWSISKDVLPTLVQAREYLVSVLTPEVTTKFPEKAARAQFMFDCWVEQQEEGWQSDDIAYCREEFYGTLDKLFGNTAKSNGVKPIKKSALEEIKPSLKTDTKLAYFKTGSSVLDDSTKRIVSNIVSRLKGVGSYDITLNGYADNVGGEELNMKLSKKRAMAIKKAFVDGGLDSKAITVFAFGNTEGRIKTKRGVASKENRVVEIVLGIK